jgi:hypothetical protein
MVARPPNPFGLVVPRWSETEMKCLQDADVGELGVVALPGVGRVGGERIDLPGQVAGATQPISRTS